MAATYRAPAASALIHAALDDFTAVFHRPSGITHLLTSPAPEILSVLSEEGLTLAALRDRLGVAFDLADGESLIARVDELVGAGLVLRE